ncbi:hypothetical protein N6G95_03450 [Pediococcus inopinatus]|nr:hypothetical protein [Pediococcus inopinatus]WPC20251.1 hypothetical protein N6G95_03450 [Pediococcus inopinatus]
MSKKEQQVLERKVKTQGENQAKKKEISQLRQLVTKAAISSLS